MSFLSVLDPPPPYQKLWQQKEMQATHKQPPSYYHFQLYKNILLSRYKKHILIGSLFNFTDTRG